MNYALCLKEIHLSVSAPICFLTNIIYLGVNFTASPWDVISTHMQQHLPNSGFKFNSSQHLCLRRRRRRACSRWRCHLVFCQQQHSRHWNSPRSVVGFSVTSHLYWGNGKQQSNTEQGAAQIKLSKCKWMWNKRSIKGLRCCGRDAMKLGPLTLKNSMNNPTKLTSPLGEGQRLPWRPQWSVCGVTGELGLWLLKARSSCPIWNTEQ